MYNHDIQCESKDFTQIRYKFTLSLPDGGHKLLQKFFDAQIVLKCGLTPKPPWIAVNGHGILPLVFLQNIYMQEYPTCSEVCIYNLLHGAYVSLEEPGYEAS